MLVSNRCFSSIPAFSLPSWGPRSLRSSCMTTQTIQLPLSQLQIQFLTVIPAQGCLWGEWLGSQGEGVLRVPPVKEPDTVHGVQDDLHALFAAQLPASMNRRILEDQPHSVMAHVCAHIDSKLGRKRKCRTGVKSGFSGLTPNQII